MTTGDRGHCLLGIETEYALTAFHTDGDVVSREIATAALMDAASRNLVGLSGGGGGLDLFLENGSRLYIDSGCHPELATPECTDPLEVVRYTLAGERILADLARDVREHMPHVSRVDLYKTNVDYGGAETSWGCHESYLYRSSLHALRDPLLPHLVSRIIFAGAGGFHPLARGIEFTLSPRAAHLMQTSSDCSTEDRGIFHTKDESLTDGAWGRLHVLCGESLSSERSMWLKLGTTALVVALADRGAAPGISLRSPLKALRAFAADPRCRRVVPTAHAPMSAVAIQMAYLELAEAHIDEPFMPEWAQAVCREWRESLERIRASPRFVASRLDWTIKRRFFGRWIRRRGFSWTKLDAWNRILARLARVASGAGELSASKILDRTGPWRSAVDELTPVVRDRGLSWGELARFFELRAELFELDVRFGKLGDEGLFTLVERDDPTLPTRVAGLGSIDDARTMPPTGSRASVRGALVRRLSNTSHRYRCQWHSIWDAEERRIADLGDPFASEERWQPDPRRNTRGATGARQPPLST